VVGSSISTRPTIQAHRDETVGVALAGMHDCSDLGQRVCLLTGQRFTDDLLASWQEGF